MNTDQAETPHDCPHCGCNDARQVRRGVRWGAAWTRYRCAHCGAEWTATAPFARGRPAPEQDAPPPVSMGSGTAGNDEPGRDVTPDARRPTPDDPPETAAVPYYLVACPACKSTETTTTGTRRPLRYHRCRNCGHTFRSYERTP